MCFKNLERKIVVAVILIGETIVVSTIKDRSLVVEAFYQRKKNCEFSIAIMAYFLKAVNKYILPPAYK